MSRMFNDAREKIPSNYSCNRSKESYAGWIRIILFLLRIAPSRLIPVKSVVRIHQDEFKNSEVVDAALLHYGGRGSSNKGPAWGLRISEGPYTVEV